VRIILWSIGHDGMIMHVRFDNAQGYVQEQILVALIHVTFACIGGVLAAFLGAASTFNDTGSGA
jgi:hypothetical protein